MGDPATAEVQRLLTACDSTCVTVRCQHQTTSARRHSSLVRISTRCWSLLCLQHARLGARATEISAARCNLEREARALLQEMLERLRSAEASKVGGCGAYGMIMQLSGQFSMCVRFLVKG
jgi:hypothetical protein